MDSITQITLGAAVGEVVLGRKLGNRAMLWGGVAGTIPDLDIIGNLFMSEVGALAFHRGFSHSIFFAATFSFLMAYIANSIYSKNIYKEKWYRIVSSILGLGFTIIVILGFSGIVKSLGSQSAFVASLILLISAGLYLMYRMLKNYTLNQPVEIDVDYRSWYWFFFWTLVTHPILDCFTTYGTQLFAPFSDYRVSFNNISVADPAYTVWYFVFLIPAAFFNRSNKLRKYFAIAALSVSGLYMLKTIYNKHRVNQVFEKTLVDQGLKYDRYMTSPTILNNILWYCLAQDGNKFYFGLYSFNDKNEVVYLDSLSQNEHLIQTNGPDHTVETLKWFSKNYFSILEKPDGSFQFNDLRFGTFDRDKDENADNDYIFSFNLVKQKDGSFEMLDTQAGPPDGDQNEMMNDLWTRIKGIE